MELNELFVYKAEETIYQLYHQNLQLSHYNEAEFNIIYA